MRPALPAFSLTVARSHFERAPLRRAHRQLDPDNANATTGWRNDIESRVGQLPTGLEIADQYLTSTAAGTTYATQSTVGRVRADLNVLVQAAADDEFPLCDPLRVPTRGNTTDHEEHVPGTVVGISCNRGNALTGASEAICLSNATWSYRGAVPTCRQCSSRWLDVPWALNRWENIQGNGAGRSRDFRTGNPGGLSSFNLPAVAIGNGGVTGLRFYFQCNPPPRAPPHTHTQTRIPHMYRAHAPRRLARAVLR